MKKTTIKRVLLSLTIILVVVYYCAGILFDPSLVIFIKPFIIPIFIGYAVLTNGKQLTLNYFLFVSFFYAYQLLILFWEDSAHLFRAAMVASFFCYLSLIRLGYRSIKRSKLYTLPSGFTLFILLLNCMFLLLILYILISAIGDQYLNIILVFNAIITVFLGVTAVLYLSKFGDRKAYYFFFGAFALIFNDVFAAIGTYFVHNIVLNSLDRLLHFGSFYLIYLFVVSKKKVENHLDDSQPSV
ncbi:hypothetical protein IWX83_001754 [Flavobacterium sp. CG_9.1]|uniref:hypothetical protein n=1 Tax=Flavobacterium sp. CG_9.1 TaxID=2787728 RepID=UPI0018C9865C|nr:hypothetical protein [Flavobacterium sp. CG_9.1]MBG6061960.1 hypothetical protein [Flavobacterium sp. CG_9.1]